MRSFALPTPKTSSNIIALGFLALLIACSTRTHQPVDARLSSDNAKSTSAPPPNANLPLKVLADIPLSGGPTRLDYQSLDSVTGRLYVAHLGSDLMTVFDVNK